MSSNDQFYKYFLQVADDVNAKQFSIVGFESGAFFALHCASYISNQRLTGISIAPYEPISESPDLGWLQYAMSKLPLVETLKLNCLRYYLFAYPEHFSHSLIKSVKSEEDAQIIRDSSFDHIKHGMLKGTAGILNDYHLKRNPDPNFYQFQNIKCDVTILLNLEQEVSHSMKKLPHLHTLSATSSGHISNFRKNFESMVESSLGNHPKE